MQKIIAVVGMPGSGKSEAIHYLMERYQWPKIYFAQPTFDEMERRGLERNQANERLVREDLRNLHGEDYYAQEAAKKVLTMPDAPVILLESFYSAAEYRVFHERFREAFLIIAIHARPKLRHERLATRPERPLTAEEAVERDWAQLNRLTQGTPISLADYMIINESTREALQAGLDAAVADIMTY